MTIIPKMLPARSIAKPDNNFDRYANLVVRARTRRPVPSPAPENDCNPFVTTNSSRDDRPDVPADADTVGYGKPPRAHRFKKGQSGNPKGRPKGAKGLKTIARKLLTEKVSVRTGGGLKRMNKMEAMLHKLAEQAFAGNLRAITLLLNLYQESVPDLAIVKGGVPLSPMDMDEHDRAILAQLRKSLIEGEGNE